MANPEIARKKLRDFLMIETGNSIALKIARTRIKEEKLACTPTQYIENNRAEIKRLVLDTVDTQASNIIPERYLVYVLKQFGIVAFLLVPAIYSLIEYAVYLYSQPQLDFARIGACLAAILFISIIFIGFVISFFKTK